ncbi:MAG: glycosyltransferase family 2 protein [Oscillospiraceae bacterium]|jgi:cellulose synthase/poly-beta-1,6-N-acetylglucosamine synthase-like glycosyltransferase|nr:glycosyltransferase family 2 protein [Oscillospiraceae bacterium]
MNTFRLINLAITLFLFVCYAYQSIYILIPFIKKTPPPKKAAGRNRFAVLICARNEEAVIADLINCLHEQTYDRSLISVFVMADNCTDSTAETARAAGATVYERFNVELIGKGYALEALLRGIKRDYPGCFDGFFVFDADNILAKDYIEQMNRTFSEGFEIVTSYRNSKNYGDNWLSAGYSLWFMRESRFLNHSRSLLGLSCTVSGTGFLFSQKIIDSTNGWIFHTLTEDLEFSAHHISNGVTIGYCPGAVLYDEQPVTLRQSFRQRMRWAKGMNQVFVKYGARLARGAARGSFSCFDLSMILMPIVLPVTVNVVVGFIFFAFGALQGESLLTTLRSLGQTLLNMYIPLLILGTVTTVSEWKRIRAASIKKILYIFTLPLFVFTSIPISFAALFAKVEWKPIKHRISAAALNAENRF